MDDAECLYHWAYKLGKRPTEEQEEEFVETVGKLMNDGHTHIYARREAFRRIYG